MLAIGAEVTVFARRTKMSPFSKDLEVVVGDRRDPEAFRRGLGSREFDAVIDLAAFSSSDVQSAVKTLSGRVGHYLLCSSGAVYRDFDDSRQFLPVREEEADLTFHGDGTYSEGKRGAEGASSLFECEGQVPVTTIRPSVVEGPEDASGRTWYWVQRVRDGGPVLVPQTVPSTIFGHVYVEDVASAFQLAASNPTAFGKTYNVTGDEILTLDDYVRMITRFSAAPGDIVSAPLSKIRGLSGLENFSAPFAAERFVMKTDRIKTDLGWRPTPLGEWLARTVRWHAKEFRGPDSAGYSNRDAETRAARILSGISR